MTTWMSRKVAQICPREGCGNPPSETSVLCEQHRLENNRRQTKHQALKKAGRDRRLLRLLCRAAQQKLL